MKNRETLAKIKENIMKVDSLRQQANELVFSEELLAEHTAIKQRLL